ncbi:type II secretion system protein [Rubellicoccus peritrichatus]|uniref:Prepilin-type N-terminal cleavage/methylation domain-containing protein n=1 Tax=Rubellicoccus peritrichatus TaxID=3080537 RepID=A0AAQ3QUB8_9BACT|nr:prepilin-type N-terminal cleavage/methylation domain-containing protein [Puniceicoccus sp. CR14]WOO39497.1 prepilin-type N-terminal cleavage/methylation domain-containing protein [Puniceicoccus sp. CR14]
MPNELTQFTLPIRVRRGFTIMELLVVLTILAAVGGGVVMTVSNGMSIVDGTGRSITHEEVATRATLLEIEKALMGNGAEAGYYSHALELPTRIAGLLTDVDSLGAYNFATKRGWNGPYLFDSGATYGASTEAGDTDNFIATYGLDSDPAILDGWGKPIILQESDTSDARIVSAGPNQVIETDPNNAIDADRGDDIVQFLRDTDPNL